MAIMARLLVCVRDYVVSDWQTNPVRCVLEIFAWSLSFGCAVTMMLTVPNVPFLILYPLFMLQCIILAWASKTRGSTGMLANYILLIAIDSIALVKLLIMN